MRSAMAIEDNTFSQIAPVGHGGAVLAILTAWAGVLTPLLTAVATIASIVWFGICIWESQTIQHWKNNFIMKRRTRKLIKLKTRELQVQAQITAMELVRSAKVDARDLVASAAVDAAHLAAAEPAATAAKLAEQAASRLSDQVKP